MRIAVGVLSILLIATLLAAKDDKPKNWREAFTLQQEQIESLAARVKALEARTTGRAQKPAAGQGRGLDAIVKEAKRRCPVCKGRGKVDTSLTRGFGSPAAECVYCKGSKKAPEGVTGWTAQALLAAKKAGTLKARAHVIVRGKLKRGGTSGRWKAWLEFQGPGSLHSVRCDVELQPDAAARLDRLKQGDEVTVYAMLIDPIRTMRSEGSVFLAQCWILASK